MRTESIHLETPSRARLQSQAIELRIALKDFERTFAEQYGNKPRQIDIKNNPSIAAKYKQYNKVQDVLSGKLPYEKLSDSKHDKRSKSRTHDGQDSIVGSSPRKRQLNTTPRKSEKHPSPGNCDDPTSTSPHRVLLNAIGPTPHRDGKVLGLFDMLQRSGSAVTPSTVRKRKIAELYEDSPVQRSPLTVIQTPSGRPSKRNQPSDLLDHLSGTPQEGLDQKIISLGKHSRTPPSDGRKFQLSQFFATPSTQRFLFQDGVTEMQKTPLRDLVLGGTPQRQPDTAGLDATPVYLRRSTSFKDRLLSASKPATNTNVALQMVDLRPSRTDPPTLRHFRSSTSNILRLNDVSQVLEPPPQRAQARSQLEEHNYDSDHDDELEAMLHMEAEQHGNAQPSSKVLVEDSQINLDLLNGNFSSPVGLDEDGSKQPPRREYKKKGQKRTTRKANIKPVTQSKKAVRPVFVAADEDEDDEEAANDEVLDETQLVEDNKYDELNNDNVDDDDDNDDDNESARKGKKLKSAKGMGRQGNDKAGGKAKKQAGRINPNAQSHMNFRTLKIKNKNSKGKVGGGKRKFGKR